MNMNGAFSRRILCTSAICTLMLGCIAAAQEESEEVEWGTGKFTIQCYPKEYSSAKNSTNLYWYYGEHGEEEVLYVKRFRGNVTYNGENPRSGVLNDDGSMTLKADYTSDGKYKCTYRSGNSFRHTRITVRVIEPPLRVLECNSTSDANHSCRCQVTFPSDKETLTLTFIKAGRLGSNGSPGSLVPVNEAHLPVVSESKHTRRNDDNSTTISAQYVLNVSELTASDMLQVPLYETKEECTVEFTKRERREGRPGAGTTLPVVAVVVVLVLVLGGVIVLLFLVRSKKLSLQRVRESCCRGNNGSPHIRSTGVSMTYTPENECPTEEV